MQRGQSRTAYILAALDSSIKARKCCGKESSQIIEESSSKYSSNLLKIIILTFIAVMTGTELQMHIDLQDHKGNIQSLSNLILESRNSGYALVYIDKTKLKKPTSLNLTLFRFGMGPEFSSDVAGDGPRKRIDSDGEYDPELERIKKKKATKKMINMKRSKAQSLNQNRKRKRSKAQRQADNLKHNPKRKRTKAERRADNLKQN